MQSDGSGRREVFGIYHLSQIESTFAGGYDDNIIAQPSARCSRDIPFCVDGAAVEIGLRQCLSV
jgi:hypothetical protein